MRVTLLLVPALLLLGCPGPAATPKPSGGPEDAVAVKLPGAGRTPGPASAKPSAGPVPTIAPSAAPSGAATPPGSGFASPPPAPGGAGFVLAFSQASGDNADRSGFVAGTTTGTWTPAAGEQPLDVLRVEGVQQAKKQRTFTLALHLKPAVGTKYPIANNERIREGAIVRYQEYETFVTWSWLATAGTAEVVAVDGARVAFKLSGVTLAPEPGNTAAKGGFTVDGTATADVAGL